MITPEQKAAIAALLSQLDAPEGPPPAGGMDQEGILNLMDERLVPAFEMIGQKFKSFEDRICELEDTIYKMVTSFSDAVGSNRKNTLMGTISTKYGADLEPFKGVYSDFRGSDLTEDLIAALLDTEEDPDTLVPGYIAGLKEKFGKYLSTQPEGTASEIVVASGEDGAPIVEMKEGVIDPESSNTPKASDSPAPDIVAKPKSTGDPVLDMMNKLESVRGPRKTA